MVCCPCPKLWLRRKFKGCCPCADPRKAHTQPSSVTENSGWEWEDQMPVIFLLLIEVLIVVGIYLYHLWWTRRQRWMARQSGIMKKSEAYSLDLVRYLLPSVQVERHRFRGMKLHSEEMSIAFEDLGLELPNGSQILEGVTGEFRAGRMCAIMGPSGAGKTTFMNVLCGKATYGKMTGRIFINGVEEDVSTHKAIIGFVPQEDIVHEGLTVGEQIRFSAELRNQVDMPAEDKDLITEDVLNVMQIEHIQNSIVGGVEERGISGGQRKRVNIGLELAANPTVLFLDEPTSGLDATSSLTIVHSLKKMTQLGMTNIMVIHQPRYSLFTLFDDVLLLGKGGKTVYLGPSLGAKPYFESLGFVMREHENPADWLMDVISGEVPNPEIPNFDPFMLFDLWEANKAFVETYVDAGARKWTHHDDQCALARKLEEEWDKIDTDKNGVMDETELQRLLTLCTRMEPELEVVRELVERMAGCEATVVKRRQFLEFLVGLQDVVAHDRKLTRKISSHESGWTLSCSFPTIPARQQSSMDTVMQNLPSTPPVLSKYNSREVLVRKASHLNREQPGCWRQFQILFHRKLIQWWRNNRQRGLFLSVIIMGAVVLAVMDKMVCEEPDWGAEPYLNLHTCLALLTSVYCLGVFGADRPVFWRESASGMNVFAFYWSRVIMNAIDLLLQSFLFAAVYYLIRQPRICFEDFFQPFLLVSFTSSGVGYVISTILPPKHGPFVAALVSFVSCGLLGHPLRVGKLEDGGLLEASMDILSITRWSVAMSFVRNLDATNPSVADYEEQLELDKLEKIYRTEPMWQEHLDYWNSAVVFLLGIGLVLHVAGYLGLKFTNRDKQV